MRSSRLLTVALVSWFSAPALVGAQDMPPPDPAAQPEPVPAPADQPPTAVPADPNTAPPPATPPPASPAAPAPEYAPAPAPEPQYAPPPQRYEGQISPGEESDPYAAHDEDNGDGDGGGESFEMPPISFRLDPFNWLLQGRLPLELEVGVWKMMTIELVPEFVTNEDPPLRDFSAYEDGALQYSNGLGDLSGTSLGVGFWLDGEPFAGYVIRAIFTNYGYEYKSSDAAGTIDSVTRTTRRFGGFIGSYQRWSFFTIGGGIGLSYELHQQERCALRATSTAGGTRITDDPDASCDGELQVALDRGARAVDDTNGFLHPFYLDARFSLGFIID